MSDDPPEKNDEKPVVITWKVDPERKDDRQRRREIRKDYRALINDMVSPGKVHVPYFVEEIIFRDYSRGELFLDILICLKVTKFTMLCCFVKLIPARRVFKSHALYHLY